MDRVDRVDRQKPKLDRQTGIYKTKSLFQNMPEKVKKTWSRASIPSLIPLTSHSTKRRRERLKRLMKRRVHG